MSLLLLLRNEALKSSRRASAWTVVAAWSAVAAFGVLEMQRAAAHGRFTGVVQFPGALPQLLASSGRVALFCAAAVLILLVASEYSEKTARRSVIDGLSKEQFFLGKLMLLPLVTAAFLGVTFAIIVAGTLAGGGASALPVQRSDLPMLGGVALAFVGFGALALLCATVVRSAGSALAVFFLYAVFLERLIGATASTIGLAGAARFLPVTLFLQLADPVQWDGAALQRLTDRLASAGASPELLPTPVLVAAATTEIAGLLIASFLIFRRRDL